MRACACSATQELRGLGLANLVGAAFNCYTTTGSFSRSAIMNDVGAKTQLAGITSGLWRLSDVQKLPHVERGTKGALGGHRRSDPAKLWTCM